jgi:PAS domain S-box-containing protein
MAAVRGEKDFDTTFQILQKNTGDIQAIRSRAFVLRNGQGQPIKMLGINIDRTREARLELELTKTTKFLEQTGDLAKVGGWELDIRTGTVHMTRQTQILHEIDEDYKPLPYATGSEWYPQEAWPVIKAAVTAAIERGVPYDLESPFITAKGRRIWVRVQGFPLVEDGRVTRLRGTFQDISERKKADEDLAIFKNVLDNATDFVGIFNTSLVPIYVNPFGRKLVGLSLDQDVGQTKLEEYYPDDLRAELVPFIESSMKSGGFWTGETEYRHFKSNERIAVADTHFSVRRAVDGEILGYAAIASDIRAEKKLQRDAEEASQQLEMERAKTLRNAKLASLGEMSAGIAHEINNPLTIIYGTVRALPKFLNNPDQLNAKIANIQSASERISKIVRSLRKFSRTAEKSDYKIYSLAEIIKEAIVLTGAKAQRHSTRLELESSADCRIFCDEIELEQVFVNMINNAIDAVKDLPDPWVILRLTESDRQLIVHVRDSGPGISPDVQKKLFQPFFTTKPVGQGTGLGLSIVKGILDEHQATIEILSHDPHTCFEIRFAKVEDKHDAS